MTIQREAKQPTPMSTMKTDSEMDDLVTHALFVLFQSRDHTPELRRDLARVLKQYDNDAALVHHHAALDAEEDEEEDDLVEEMTSSNADHKVLFEVRIPDSPVYN